MYHCWSGRFWLHVLLYRKAGVQDHVAAFFHHLFTLQLFLTCVYVCLGLVIYFFVVMEDAYLTFYSL